jgi:hypothetical protein
MSDGADKTAEETRVIGRPFEPGNNANPKGRPKGSRNKLGEDFLKALHDDFTAHGISAIAEVREKTPHHYMKVIASILPKELNIRIEDELSDSELDDRIRQLAAALRLEAGVGNASEGEAAADTAQPAGDVSTLH